MTSHDPEARGAELLAQMLGPEEARQLRADWAKISPELEGYIVSFVAGEIWSRPGLDLRTKSLVTITALAAQGRTRALELNVRLALGNGATRRDIVEALLQIAPYAGFPAAWEALATARRVFEQKDADGD